MAEMTPLERAAKALWEHRSCEDGMPPSIGHNWETLDGVIKGLWIGQARAVLTAIREPSDAILMAMRNTVPVDGFEWEYRHEEAAAHWQAMIDAALAEQP